ncbi:unnamed protein product [Timema podura]|uniref:Uncharacterized protein n=1 Tax=Timema podura TaxID=61482 RepID=A0ABN7P1U0_TIMPD|nr:unnamed protein product [Timema podura]
MATLENGNRPEEGGWIPGLGENRPHARQLGKSFFGYVPDAFSMKGLSMPSDKSLQSSNVKGPDTDFASVVRRPGPQEILLAITQSISITTVGNEQPDICREEEIHVQQVTVDEAYPIDDIVQSSNKEVIVNCGVSFNEGDIASKLLEAEQICDQLRKG